MTPATSGRTSPRQFAYFDRDSSCWRTWPAISLWGPETFSGTLPKRGSMRSGALFEHPTWVPATSEPASSSSLRTLPTPVANDDHKRPEAHLAAKVRSGAGEVITSLDVMARQAAEAGEWSRKLLPTPTSAAGLGGNLSRSGDRGDELLLPGLVKTFLPTPTTSDANGAGAHGDGGADLRTAIKTLPTPTVGDSKDARNSTATRHRTPPTGVHAGDTLTDWATKLLPTPTTQPTTGNGHARNLGAEAKRLLPTPTARDHKGQNQRRDQSCLPGAITALPSSDTPESSDEFLLLPWTGKDD